MALTPMEQQGLEIKEVTIPATTTGAVGDVLLYPYVPDTAKIVQSEYNGTYGINTAHHWQLILRGANTSGAPVINYPISAFKCWYIE